MRRRITVSRTNRHVIDGACLGRDDRAEERECSPILMHWIGHHPLLMVSGVSGRWLNILVLVFRSFSRPGHSLVRAGCIHDMLFLKMRVRTTRSHILQELVFMYVIILKKILIKKKLLKKKRENHRNH